MEEQSQVRYAGFWRRALANLIDSLILAVLIVLALLAWYGASNLETARSDLDGVLGTLIEIALAVVIVAFWRYCGGTPGKMLLSQKIVDARTLEPPSTGQLIGRFFAYFVSTLPLGLGFLWIAFDRRKQGWHDKLSGTVVIDARQRR